jgi:hypothetical protein
MTPSAGSWVMAGRGFLPFSSTKHKTDFFSNPTTPFTSTFIIFIPYGVESIINQDDAPTLLPSWRHCYETCSKRKSTLQVYQQHCYYESRRCSP